MVEITRDATEGTPCMAPSKVFTFKQSPTHIASRSRRSINSALQLLKYLQSVRLSPTSKAVPVQQDYVGCTQGLIKN
jgi:hypothetical protein